MDLETYLRAILVLVFVLGLVLLLGWVLRRSGIRGGALAGKGRRLGVVETAFLGPKHRLVLVRRDSVEHLVLIGPTSTSVVETGIAERELSERPRESFRALVSDQLDAAAAAEQRPEPRA